MTHKLLHIELSIESPTIVVKEAIKNWYSTYRVYIPARVFYGALATSLINDLGFKPDEVLGSINVSDLYPMNHGLSLPSIPLVFVCKGSRKFERALLEKILDRIMKNTETIDEQLAQEIISINASIIKLCEIHGRRVRSKGLVRSIGGSPIYCKKDYCYIHPSLSIVVLESVGISPITHSSHGGLIYTYEALAPGNKVHGILACIDKLCNIIEDKKEEISLYLGRGSSKGYGRLKITSVTPVFNGVNINEYFQRYIIEASDKQVMIALSPIIDRKLGNIFGKTMLSDIISKMDVWVYTREVYHGWSKLYGSLKPILSLAGHGSLVIYRFDTTTEPLSDYYETILSSPGLNFIIPLTLYRDMLLGGDIK